jgi:hypothetical protein
MNTHTDSVGLTMYELGLPDATRRIGAALFAISELNDGAKCALRISAIT